MTKFFHRHCLATTAIIGSFAGLASPALAQSAPSASVQLDEVVVTAEHRSQSLQSTPLAISVRDGGDLEAQGRTSVEQILEDVPGVNFIPNVGSVAKGDTAANALSIRGIGSNGAVPGNTLQLVPAVAQYVDGIVGGIGGNHDLDQVEILRGPQGTLYGRSATAGVVNIHTKNPNSEGFSADVSAEVGNYALRRLSAGVNVPLSDTFAVRISGQSMSQDGFEVKDSGRNEQSNARIKALFTPNEKLSVLLGAAYEEREYHSGGVQVHWTAAGLDKTTRVPLGTGTDEHKQFWAEINYDLGFATLVYIPGYRSYTKSEIVYGNFGALTLISAENNFNVDTFHTEEVRLVSNGDGRFSWQGGLFYYDNEIETDRDQTFGGFLKLHLGVLKKQTKNLGIFAEGTYKFTDATRLTVGLRHDDTRIDTNERDCSGSLAAPALTCVQVNDKRDAQNITYKVRLDHDIAEDFLVYGSVSSAFLPGDVAIVTGVGGALTPSPYDPQTLTSYEAGAKYRGFDNKLQINGAAFFYDYGGFQQNVGIGTFLGVNLSAIRSSPAQVKGAEVEILYRPTSADTIEVTASALDARYRNKPALFAAAVAQTKIPTMKPFEATASYSHLFQLGGGHDLRIKGELQYSAAYDTAILTPAQAANAVFADFQRQGAVTLGNLYATWRTGGPVTVSAYVRNVTDEFYKAKVTPGSAVSARTQIVVGAPRTVGVVLNAKF